MKKKYLFIGLLAGVTLLAACISKTNKNKKSNTSSKTKIVKQEKPDKVTQIFKNMTLNEKIGQLYFTHSTGNTHQMLHDVKKYQLGGTTLFAKDFENKSRTKFRNEMKQYQTNSKHDLLIATDQEAAAFQD